jgi:uncharacterized membrane protein
MHQFRWVVATAAAAILASAFSTQPAAVAETNKKAKRCVVAAAPKPDCGANAKAVCVAAKVSHAPTIVLVRNGPACVD